MTTDSERQPLPNHGPNARSFSRWSIASLFLFGLALATATFTVWFVLQSPGTGPAEGAVVALVVGVGGVTYCTCALLGAIFGWLGWQRSATSRGFAVTIAVLNTAACFLPIVAPILWQIVIEWQRRV